MYPPLNDYFHPSRQLLCPACGLIFLPATYKMHSAMSRRQVSPTPTGLTPGCLSSVISLMLINAR